MGYIALQNEKNSGDMMEQLFDQMELILEQLMLSGVRFLPGSQVDAIRALQKKLTDLNLIDGATLLDRFVTSNDRPPLFADLNIWFQTIRMEYEHMMI